MEEFNTLFDAAIQEDNILAVATLLNQKHQPTTGDFVQAVERSAISILEIFLQVGFPINKPIRTDYPPPLACALSDRNLSKWLLDHGADPNARCYYDITPLSIAAESASLEVIQLLFDYGASVEHGAPLHYAVRSQRPDDIIEFFIRKGAPVNELLFSNDTTSWNYFSKILPLGTPLHEAARDKNERIVRLLLHYGADPGVKDNFGCCPDIADSKL